MLIFSTAWAVLKPFLGFIAAAAVGFAAAETWEHTNHPSVLGWSPFGQSLSTQLTAEKAAEPAKLTAATKVGIAQQTASDAATFAQWGNAVKTANQTATDARNAAAAAAAQASAATSKQASAAYQLGRATCGASTNANPSPAAVGGAPAAGSVRDAPGDDFATLFAAGAYAPATPVPVSGGGS